MIHFSNGTSELAHAEELNHFQLRFNRARYFKQTESERRELNRRMRRYPSKNGAPVPPNR